MVIFIHNAAKCASLMVIVCWWAVSIAEASSFRPRMWPGVRRARVIRYLQSSKKLDLHAGNRSWSVSVDPVVTAVVKNGKTVSLSDLNSGDQVAVQSFNTGFEQASAIADLVSYAAYLHDDHYYGKVNDLSSVTPQQSLLTIVGLVNPLRRHGAQPDTSYQFRLHPDTQFWLGGKRRSLAEALASIGKGASINVTVSLRGYRSTKGWPLPAFAVFDDDSWKAFATSQLSSSRSLFVPANPQPIRSGGPTE